MWPSNPGKTGPSLWCYIDKNEKNKHTHTSKKYVHTQHTHTHTHTHMHTSTHSCRRRRCLLASCTCISVVLYSLSSFRMSSCAREKKIGCFKIKIWKKKYSNNLYDTFSSGVSFAHVGSALKMNFKKIILKFLKEGKKKKRTKTKHTTYFLQYCVSSITSRTLTLSSNRNRIFRLYKSSGLARVDSLRSKESETSCVDFDLEYSSTRLFPL